MHSRFIEKNILITGGASGMGAAVVRLLAAEGARNIFILDRDEGKAQSLIAALGGSSIHYVACDLSKQADIEAAAAQVAAKVDALHGLVNCAGILGGGNMETAEYQRWELVLSINLIGPAWLVKSLLPLLKKEGASIVNILTDGAFKGRVNGPYDASKAGLWSVTKSMAAQWVGDKVRVNAVAPGWTVTEIHYGSAPDPEKRKAELMAWDTNGFAMMKRAADPAEIARPILFLLSDESSYMTGSVLNVDGGRVGF